MGGVVFPISPKIFHPAAAGMVELLQRFAGCAAGIAYGVAAACTHQKPPPQIRSAVAAVAQGPASGQCVRCAAPQANKTCGNDGGKGFLDFCT